MDAVAIVDLHGIPHHHTDALVALVRGGGWRTAVHDARAGQLPRGPSPIIITGGPGGPDDRGLWRVRLQAAVVEWASQRPLMAVGLGFSILATAMGWPVRRLNTMRQGWHPVTQTTDGLTDPVLGSVPQGALGYEDRPWAVLPPPAATASRNTVLSFTSAGDVAAARFGAHAVGLAFHPEATVERPHDAVPAAVVTQFVSLATGGGQ